MRAVCLAVVCEEVYRDVLSWGALLYMSLTYSHCDVWGRQHAVDGVLVDGGGECFCETMLHKGGERCGDSSPGFHKVSPGFHKVS
jgi:hypothetical protein